MAADLRHMGAESARPPRANAAALVSLGSSIAALLLFGLLSVDAAARPYATYDVPVLRAVQGVDLPYLNLVMRPIEWLTSGPGAVLMWVLTLAGLLAARWWLPAAVLALLPIAGGINQVIGHPTRHTRPSADLVDPWASGDMPSFPSGHVVGAVLLYGLLFVYAEQLRPRPLRWLVRGACVVIVAVTGFARLWYGAHWPSDVLAAYVLGGIQLAALLWLYRLGQRVGDERLVDVVTGVGRACLALLPLRRAN